MKMNIAIIEYKKNIDEARKYFSKSPCLFLSVSAEASYHLMKRNIEFITDEEVLSSHEFIALGDENFILTEQWIDKLERVLQSEAPLFKEKEFLPFRWHFYRLKIMVDAVRIRRVLLERLIEKWQPEIIAAPPDFDVRRIHDSDLFFHKYDSLYGALVQRVARQKKIKTHIWLGKRSTVEYTNIQQKIYHFLRAVKRSLKKLIRTKTAHEKYKKDHILVGNAGYDITFLIQSLSNQFTFDEYNVSGHSAVRRPLSRPAINYDKIFKSIEATESSIDNEILLKRVISYAKRYIPVLWEKFNQLDAMAQTIDFKAYFHHAGAGDAFSGLPVFYFAKKNKPVIIVQHGCYGVTLSRRTCYCEFGHDGYFLAWGDGIREMYDQRKKGKCSFVPTGSHVIDQIWQNRIVRKKISKVCYLPGLFLGYVTLAPDGQPYWDSRMFIMETKFLTALKS